MIWQEWKEGFARWVENRVKRKIGLPENIKGSEPPYSRVSFYAGGEALIEYLLTVDETIINDLSVLFKEMISTVSELACAKERLCHFIIKNDDTVQ